MARKLPIKPGRPIWAWFCVSLLLLGISRQGLAAGLKSPQTQSGYVAHLLVNEVPFPGERGYVSESDTKAAMLSIVWVLNSRIAHVPSGYRQRELAATVTTSIIDVITVGGVHGQCDGFYRDSQWRFTMVSRVTKRLDNLTRIANTGKPGRFARLFGYGQGLADAYFVGGINEADRYAQLKRVRGIPVTGRAYSWMQDRDYYHPGGDFVKIPDANQGSLGGNRFSTLKKRNAK
jgi:hypothetical protein